MDDKMVEDDRCWDGNWLADGCIGMFIRLSEENFCEEELELYLEEQKEKGERLSTSNHRFKDAFVFLPTEGDELGWTRLKDQILKPRKLHVANGVIRMFLHGGCPPRIRIQKLEPEEMEELLDQKKLGNQAFSNHEYEKAIQHYEEALLYSNDLYVAPIDQVDEIVNILSNQAECYLRLKNYKDAGKAATDALMFNSNHVKSRLRRAKAEIAITHVSYLAQAEVDLQNILTDHCSKGGVKQVKEYLTKVEGLLDTERKKFEKQKPDSDWDTYLRVLKSTCW